MLDKMFRKEIHGYKTKELMTKHVITLPPEASLLESQHKMLRYKIKKIVVVNANTIGKKVPIGILTVKDIIKSALSHETDADLYEMRISEAMTKSLVIVEQNDSILDCAKLLKENRDVGSAIVVKGDNDYRKGKQSPANQKLLLSGIITPTDLARFYSENCIGYTSVVTYMSHRFITISINERVSAAAQLMIDQNTSQLVVTAADSQNTLLGILSETDIARVISTFKSKTLRSVYENIGILFSSFTSNSLCKQCLAGPRRAVKQNALRSLNSYPLKYLRMTKWQLYHLTDFLDLVLQASNVFICDPWDSPGSGFWSAYYKLGIWPYK